MQIAPMGANGAPTVPNVVIACRNATLSTATVLMEAARIAGVENHYAKIVSYCVADFLLQDCARVHIFDLMPFIMLQE